jgi:hypothetical protein
MDLLSNAPPVLTLRDVVDVQAYVTWTIERAGLSPDDGERGGLIRAGVECAFRLERALPPERPLLPVLEQLLAATLVDLSAASESERRASSQPTAIAA